MMNQTLSKPQDSEQLDAKAGCPALPSSALFVPLMTQYYEAFRRGEKTEELRLYGPRWNEKTCRVGREVTLSKGYGKKNRLYGRIWKFKRQHGATFGSAYKAAILDRYKTLDVWIAVISVNLFTACGGCGTQNPHKRCIGCFHPFEPNVEAARPDPGGAAAMAGYTKRATEVNQRLAGIGLSAPAGSRPPIVPPTPHPE